MRVRLAFVLVAVFILATAATGSAQQPGEIFGKAVDASGGVMPGITVTLSGPTLLQPMVATTSATGTYRFPGLSVGSYTVKFELEGFKTLVRQGVRVEIGANVQINATMEISSLQETVTVSGETPVVDLRDTSKTSRFTQEALQSIPSARDPWVIIEQSASVAMDRQNVGGSASGQQSNFVARGAAMSQQKWNLDGVDITDMAATGGSPIYFDFDSFEEMQISAGGADVTMQSPGVGVNLVTKSGTDRLRGSGRLYITDEKFQSVNVTDEFRKQGAATGNPIQNIQDYGTEVGGPLQRGKAWFWGSASRQKVDVGINNFYKNTPECLAMKASPLNYSVNDLRGCLNTDQTLLNNYNAKLAVETFKNNQFSFLFNAAEKVRNARDASDLRPLETTYRQMGVSPKAGFGSRWWKTGMPKTYKWSDRHIFNDRLMMEASYAHVGNNFEMAFHEDNLRSVQPSYDIDTQVWGRSYQDIIYVRPTDSVDAWMNYFLPGVLGGDHSFKAGFKWRDDMALTSSIFGGDAYARFQKGVGVEAQLYRSELTNYGLHNRNFYAQDTFTRKRLTLNLGVRVDYQTDWAEPQQIEASPFHGKATFAGVYQGVTYTGAPFNQLPALSFPGAKALGDKDLWFKSLSPRLGVTYDLTGNGRNVVKFNYARYVGQLGGNSGRLASRYNTIGLTYVRYPWVDLSKDGFIQANEIVLTKVPLGYTTGYNYNNPGQTTTTGRVDPNLKNDKADELLFSFDKQIGNDIGVSVSYIWRKYSDFRWSDTLNWDSSNYKAVQWTPTGCPAGADCPSVTYYEPTSVAPVEYVYTNQPDYWRRYQGVELSVRKRMTKNWLMNAGFSYNDSPAYWDSAKAYEDPTNIKESLNGGQFAEESTSSGLGNVFVNAKWIFRISGAYTLPWKVQVAAFYNSRSGYPYIRSVQTGNRPYGGGRATVYLDRRGDLRLPTFQNIDFRADKAFTLFNRMKLSASMDIFNLMNDNTTLSMRGGQNASNANTISSLLAPRVVRFGVRMTF